MIDFFHHAFPPIQSTIHDKISPAAHKHTQIRSSHLPAQVENGTRGRRLSKCIRWYIFICTCFLTKIYYFLCYFRKQLANGSLVIESMVAALAGQYQCVATVEGVGTVVSRIATLLLAGGFHTALT